MLCHSTRRSQERHEGTITHAPTLSDIDSLEASAILSQFLKSVVRHLAAFFQRKILELAAELRNDLDSKVRDQSAFGQVDVFKIWRRCSDELDDCHICERSAVA